MPYLGRPVTNAGQFETIDDISSDFNGSTKSFTLQVGGTNIQPDASNVTITLDGIVQIPSTAYTITGSTINFSEAPPSSTGFHGVLAGQSQFIESDFITNTHIKSSANISGSKINTDFSGKTIKASVFEGMISGSAQISTDISGSFTSPSSSFSTRTTNLESASGSFSTRVTTIEGSGTVQGVGTSNSPTFAGATINGTLVANEIHTTFVSSSVATITGSNVFGDAVGDLHSFTGSVSISGSQTSLVTAGNVDFNGDLDVDGTTNLDVVDIDGAVDMASTLNVTNNITTDGIFKVDTAPDDDVIQFDQGGRKSAIKTYFASNSTDSRLVLKVSDGNTNGGMVDGLDIGPARVIAKQGILEVGEHGVAGGQIVSDGDLAIHAGYNDSSTGNGDIIFKRFGESATAVELVRVASTGRLGVGNVSSPAEPLHVSGSDNGIRIQARSGTRGTLSFVNSSGTVEGKIMSNGNGDLRIGGGSSANDDIIISDNGNTAFASQVLLKEGAYNNLSLAFTNDTDTGLYLGGTNAIGFVTNGTVALELQGTQLADFRGDLHVPEYIKHRGDTDTSIRFTDNTINFSSGGSTTMQHINGGGIITHGATRATLTAGKTYSSGANVITFTVTVANTSSWEPINFLVEANYTLANLGGTGYYYGWGHTYHYSAAGLAGTSTGNGGASSNITVTCGNHSSNSFDITVTSGATSGTINMIASLDIRARHGISNIVAA